MPVFHDIDHEYIDVVVSPRRLPPPKTRDSIQVHLADGAFLGTIVKHPPLFEYDELLEVFDTFREIGAEPAQCLLVLTGNGDGRRVYNHPLAEWQRYGGTALFVYEDDSLDEHLKLLEGGFVRRDERLVDLVARLPNLSRGEAEELVEEYGPTVLFALTNGFTEDVSPKTVNMVRDFFGLEDDQAYVVSDEVNKHREENWV